MKKYLKWIFPLGVLIFLALQFTNPARTNPPVKPGADFMATNPPPPQIAAMFHDACYDCHSDETKWPWYSHIAPVSWLVASDVKHGREHVNFSEWPREYPDRVVRRLEDISEELDYNEMPPAKYTWLHPKADLTSDQRKELSKWANDEAQRLKALAKTQN